MLIVDLVGTLFSGHFLLLKYPPPTYGKFTGILSLDLYQAVPASSAHLSS